MKLYNSIISLFIEHRNAAFDKSKIYFWNELDNITEKYFRLKSEKLVISVGNLSFGGTGKTPLIETLISDILPRNLSKCIIERGYKRKDEVDLIITRDNFSNFDIDSIGDEPFLLFEKTQIPISISNKKYRAFANCIKEINPDIIIIDDGFQHRWIERDLNILILDKQSIENPNFPPFGRLREPLNEIKRADIILMPAYIVDKLPLKINTEQLMIPFEIQNGEVYNPIIERKFNTGDNFVALCGIGNPHRFFYSLEKMGIEKIERKIYPDHFNYSKREIQKLINLAKLKNASIITTEKDFVKLKQFRNDFETANISIFVLPVKFKIIDKNNLLSNLIKEKLKLKGIK